MRNLSEKEAFLAMFSFLEERYRATESDDIGALLGSMSFLSDGNTADPAIWEDWRKAVNKVFLSEVNANLNLK